MYLRLFVVFLFFILITLAFPTKTMKMVELTEGQKENLRALCKNSGHNVTLGLKSSASIFNHDAEQCKSSFLSATYVGIEFRRSLVEDGKIHAKLLLLCTGTNQIHWINMATMNTSFGYEQECKSAFAILKIEDEDIGNIEIVNEQLSGSYLNQSVQLVQNEGMMVVQGNRSCFNFPHNIPTSRDQLNHTLYRWNLCQEVTDDLDIISQIRPPCNVSINERHSIKVVEWKIRVFIGITEIADFNTKALKWTKEWHVNQIQPTCFYDEQTKEQTSTAVTILPESKDSVESSGKLIATIIVGIIGGVILIIAIVLGIRKYLIYRKIHRKNVKSSESEEAPLDHTWAISRTVNVRSEASSEVVVSTSSGVSRLTFCGVGVIRATRLERFN